MEVVVGMVIAWAVAKFRRVAGRADKVVDQALDAGVDRVGKLVTTWLAGDSALADLEAEAAAAGEVSELTQQRVQLAIQAAAQKSPEFARELEAALAAARPSQSTGSHSVIINDGVHGSDSSTVIGAVTGGTVSVRPPDPQQPARE